MTDTDRREHQSSPALNDMTRRQLLERVAALMGGAVLVGGDRLLARAVSDQERSAAAAGVGDFSAADIAFLDEVAETILPETRTPGAKAARAGAFMALMVTDAYEERDRRVFRDGMRSLDETCRSRHGVPFVQASAAQRLSLLDRLDRDQKAVMDERAAAARRSRDRAGSAKPADSPVPYFRMMKELALAGYFTSEIGYRQAMRYIESPGRFDPCVPYAPGETNWASHA